MKPKLLFVPLLVTGVVLLLGVRPGAPQERTGGEPTPITLEECAACHEEQVTAFQRNPHSALDTKGLAARAGASFSCNACHGDPTRHIDEGGGEGTIFAFGAGDLPKVKSQNCLTCHGDAHPRFFASPHAISGMDCTSCHTIHATETRNWNLLKSWNGDSRQPGRRAMGAASANCLECHRDVFAEFKFNERHRLQEGILDCTSCHNPHAPQTRMLLGGFKQEQCVDCHTDKGGPFVFEHASSRTEGCTACHSPHGSPNRHQLKFQRVAELCFSCHPAVPQFHLGFSPVGPPRFNLDTVCTNCHSTIHGSNFDPFFLK